MTIKRIEVAQTDDSRRTVVHWSGGQKREIWSLPKMNLIITEDPAGKAFATRNTISFGDPFSPSDFDWIKPGIRASDGTVKFDGVECNHYTGVIVVPSLSEKGVSQTIPCEAWIDAKTLLPVALLKGDVLGRYSFGAPVASLEMPEKFRKRLAYYKMTMGMR